MYIRELLEPSLIGRVLIPDRPFNRKAGEDWLIQTASCSLIQSLSIFKRRDGPVKSPKVLLQLIVYLQISTH